MYVNLNGCMQTYSIRTSRVVDVIYQKLGVLSHNSVKWSQYPDCVNNTIFLHYIVIENCTATWEETRRESITNNQKAPDSLNVISTLKDFKNTKIEIHNIY